MDQGREIRQFETRVNGMPTARLGPNLTPETQRGPARELRRPRLALSLRRLADVVDSFLVRRFFARLRLRGQLQHRGLLAFAQ